MESAIMDVVDTVAGRTRLNRKETRLLTYLLRCREEGHSPTIGEVCRECRTTVKTLLGKTKPELMRKLGTLNKEDG